MAEDSVQADRESQIVALTATIASRDNAAVVPARSDLRWPAGAAVVLAVTTVLAARHRPAPGEALVFGPVNDLPASAVDPVKAFMALGTWPGVVVAASVIAVVTVRFGPSLAAVAAAVLARLITPVFKDTVERGRPVTLLDDVNLRQHQDGFGFPSSHASIAFAGAAVLAWCFPRARWPALALAALVAVARMYVGVHLPLDVVGGAGLGILVATPCVLVLSLARARIGPRPDPAER
jgi:undecaprenyl-diphosphatase